VRIPRTFLRLPLVTRWVVAGALIAGIIGAAAGFAIGLAVYAPTAWFALFELGVPSACAGAVLGLVVGSAVLLVRRGR
jgi:hypothetical protein